MIEMEDVRFISVPPLGCDLPRIGLKFEVKDLQKTGLFANRRKVWDSERAM